MCALLSYMIFHLNTRSSMLWRVTGLIFQPLLLKIMWLFNFSAKKWCKICCITWQPRLIILRRIKDALGICEDSWEFNNQHLFSVMTDFLFLSPRSLVWYFVSLNGWTVLFVLPEHQTHREAISHFECHFRLVKLSGMDKSMKKIFSSTNFLNITYNFMTLKFFYTAKIFILLFGLKKFSPAVNYSYYFSNVENYGGVSIKSC